MSLHFKKTSYQHFSLISAAFLFTLLLGTKAYAENSYIIVHALNPESVEIASIQGMSQNSVEIYDGNTLIGYGAYNAETHNKPIAIASGAHTIKAKFNGMIKVQTVTVNPNETKPLTFIFERKEFDLVSYLNSVKLDYHYNLDTSYVLYPNIDVHKDFIPPQDIHKDLVGHMHIAGGTTQKGNGANVKLSVEYYIDGKNYRSRLIGEVQLTGNLSYTTWANLAVYVQTNRYIEDGRKWPDVTIVPAQSFDNWFVQYHNYKHYYPGIVFARKETPEIYQYVGPYYWPNFQKLPATYAYRKAIWGDTGTGLWCPTTQSFPYAYEDEDFSDGSVDWFMSSIPYDFVSTGIKDEEIIKIPLGKKDFPCIDNEKTYRIYVPSRYGGTLTVSTDAGVIELFYPNSSTKIEGPATKIDYSVPLDKHGWYYVKYSSTASCKITNTFTEKGSVSEEKRPWNFWYWPLKKQIDSRRNLYGPEGPLEKYDSVFKDQYNNIFLLSLKTFGYTGARDYEEKKWGGANWPSGAGHCLGGSIASILLSEPKGITYGGETFSQEEMEGLVIKLANTEYVIPAMSILPKGIKFPAKKPEEVDWVDGFADEIHKGLQKCLLQKRVPLQGDLRDPSGTDPGAIWNHAVFAYKANMEESEEGKENIIKITTKLYSNKANTPDSYPSDNNTAYREDIYTYKLKYMLNGEIDTKFSGQDWLSSSGFLPEDLVVLGVCWFDNSGWPNPYVTIKNVAKLGIKFPWYLIFKINEK